MNTAHWLTLSLAVIGAGGCSQVDNRPAEWGYISPVIFQPNCATTSCHGPAAAVDGLDFSTPHNGYESLTQLYTFVAFPPDAAPAGTCMMENGTLVCWECERPLVTPFDPAGSRVVDMLRARNAPRMPPDRPLPEADIELVERWILNGACSSDLSCPSDAALGMCPAAPVDAATSDASRADAGRADAATGRRD